MTSLFYSSNFLRALAEASVFQPVQRTRTPAGGRVSEPDSDLTADCEDAVTSSTEPGASL